MRTETLGNLRQQVLERADERLSRVPATELNTMINQSYAELYDLILSVSPEFRLTHQDITVTSGQATYTLPSDFYRSRGLDVLGTDSRWYCLERFVFAYRNVVQLVTNREDTRYGVEDNQLRLYPSPTWGGTVRLWYHIAPTRMVADADTIDGVAGWEEYIVLDVCLKIKAKNEEDTTPYQMQLEKVKARITSMASQRDISEPMRILPALPIWTWRY